MKSFRRAAGLFALIAASCSTGPTSPTQSVAAGRSLQSADGSVSSTAVTTTRLRLRIVGAGDIMTGLQTGQSINVPVNVKLDVWAEIQRLESDRGRLVVDWGNGNNDFSGCGACRLENTYTNAGRYTLTARVVDLNAPSGSEPVTTATVTINVVSVVDIPAFTCAPASLDFESFTVAAPLPVSAGGVTVAAASSAIVDFTTSFAPFIQNKTAQRSAAVPITITFDSDKNDFSAGFAISIGGTFNYSAQSATGAVVASGTFTPGILQAGASIGQLNISGVVFRKIVLTPSSAWAVDNINGACR